eukprot:m.191405 g.191405  ORF g.191405 m.191405 type:complete len:65 (+) comp14840_c0_seq2:1458-1652(+)
MQQFVRFACVLQQFVRFPGQRFVLTSFQPIIAAMKSTTDLQLNFQMQATSPLAFPTDGACFLSG